MQPRMAANRASHHAAPDDEPVARRPKDGRRVLIVEDDPDIRELLVELFDAVADVVAAGTLDDALEALRRAPFDFVVTDLQLGTKRDGGYQVIGVGALLSPDATFVVLTAYADAESRAAAQRLSAAHFLTKPVDLEALARLTPWNAGPAAADRRAT